MNRKRIITVLFVLTTSCVFLLINGFLNSKKVNFHSSGSIIRYDLKSKVDAYNPEEPLYKFITNRRWNSRVESGPFAEGGLWTFYANGKFEYSLISDYSFELEGDWKIVQLGGSKALVYLDYFTIKHEGNQDINVRIKKIIFVEAEHKHLYMNYQPFWGENVSEPGDISKAIITDSDFIKKDFPEYSLLLGGKWVKDNHINTDSVPHKLTFFEDGTFLANFIREKPCNFKGDWSLALLEPGRVEIRLFAPDANCDLRGYKGFGWGGGHIFKLTSTNLVNESFDYLNYHSK